MVRKCSRGIAEIAVMEVAQVGVRTRARATLAMAAASSGRAAKRRKISSNGELMKLSTTTTTTASFVELRSRRRVVIASTTAENLVLPPSSTKEEERWCSSPSSIDDDQVQASCCSSNGSSELAHHDDDDIDQDRTKFLDLEDDESGEVETSTYYSSRQRREMTPSSKLREESDEVDSTARPTVVDSSRRSVVADQKMPSEIELEEFFATAEKDIQKRFQEKYNYDIAKDTPLEGRYEWDRLKP
ncbi:Cyclin-dependent kinase inhibitor [Parasponia andersonii]|uniref:Cyclin-dependent kinase inhibitor n=1 Tax=Parasponia andersonii TaxID=3476 RepID=A0A2P5ATI4_PARAD|nr:Cyclin-dependent kinase inhibitor [Parasponia andersonii]